MDIFLKILLSSSLIYTINLVSRTLTANNFDKLFIPKHQKVLYNICSFIFLFIIFIGYGVLLGGFYSQIRGGKVANSISGILIIVYVVAFLFTGYLCLRKWIKEKKSGMTFNMNEKRATFLLFVGMILNIATYSILLCEMYLLDGLGKMNYLGNLMNCIILFFGLSYVLLQSHLYLIGLKKRKWNYVLSPMPENIEKKYLNVLYSLSPNQLVLSEEKDGSHNPSSVYVYDMNKNTYIYFERVLSFEK